MALLPPLASVLQGTQVSCWIFSERRGATQRALEEAHSSPRGSQHGGSGGPRRERQHQTGPHVAAPLPPARAHSAPPAGPRPSRPARWQPRAPMKNSVNVMAQAAGPPSAPQTTTEATTSDFCLHLPSERVGSFLEQHTTPQKTRSIFCLVLMRTVSKWSLIRFWKIRFPT